MDSCDSRSSRANTRVHFRWFAHSISPQILLHNSRVTRTHRPYPSNPASMPPLTYGPYPAHSAHLLHGHPFPRAPLLIASLQAHHSGLLSSYPGTYPDTYQSRLEGWNAVQHTLRELLVAAADGDSGALARQACRNMQCVCAGMNAHHSTIAHYFVYQRPTHFR